MPPLYLIAECIAFLCSILLLTKGVKKEYKIFFFYTLCVMIIEYFGLWIATVLKVPNHILYTFACFFFSSFYYFTIRDFFNVQKHKRATSLFFLLFIFFYIINILFFQRLTEFNSYSFIFGYILLVISCTLFYIEFIIFFKSVSRQ